MSSSLAVYQLGLSPVFRYRADDATGSGNAADTSGSSRTGGYNNGTAVSASSLIPGDTDAAAQFNSTGGYTGTQKCISTPTFTATTAWSLTFIAKASGAQAGGFDRLCAASGDACDVARTSTDTIIIYMPSLAAWTNTSGTLVAGETALFVIAADASGVQIYKNGVSIFSTSSAAGSVTSWLFGSSGTLEGFNGIMDEMCHYAAKLSLAQIIRTTSEFLASNSGKSPSLTRI